MGWPTLELVILKLLTQKNRLLICKCTFINIIHLETYSPSLFINPPSFLLPPPQIASCRKFYENMAEYARERSVTVNVLSLASPGDNVNLSILGILNHKTGEGGR